MSPDEVVVAVVSAITVLAGWGHWYSALLTANRLGRAHSPCRPILALTPVVCLAGLFVLLRTAASFDVRNAPTYLAFYLVFGAAWMVPGRALFSLLGISWRYDALELRNPAAAWAVAGGLAGLLACYAGANVGDGPGWWCVAVAGGLGTAVWFLAWRVVQAVGDVAEAVTVERDRDAGIRLGAFLLAAGLLCGRGAAGDWTSPEQTLIEFADAWPLVPLTIAAGWVELQATGERNRRGAPRAARLTPGWWVGVFYIGFALACLAILPGPAENPAYDAARGAPMTP